MRNAFHAGDGELGPWRASAKSAELYVMVHPPTKARAYFTAKQVKFAAEKGTPALLKKLAGRPKYAGW